MRVAWGRRAPGEARTAAYSLVYLTQELAILIGPLMLGLLVAVASASTAPLSVAAVAAAGTFVFAVSLHALPRQRSHQNGGGVLGSAPMRSVLAIALALGAPAASGILIAMLSLAGIVGAVVYGGSIGPPTRRLDWSSCLDCSRFHSCRCFRRARRRSSAHSCSWSALFSTPR
jgi:hypothetical protein